MNILLWKNSRTPLRMLSFVILFAASQAACRVDAQPPSPHPIRMVSAAVPFYPEDAEAAGIEGTIGIKIRVRDGEVIDARVQGGPIMLKRAALANVHTWHFDTALTVTFDSTFTYKLMPARGCDEERQRLIALNLPYSVEITSSYIQTCDPAVDSKPHR